MSVNIEQEELFGYLAKFSFHVPPQVLRTVNVDLPMKDIPHDNLQTFTTILDEGKNRVLHIISGPDKISQKPRPVLSVHRCKTQNYNFHVAIKHRGNVQLHMILLIFSMTSVRSEYWLEKLQRA